MPIYHVAFDGAEANVHAHNRISAVKMLQFAVENDMDCGDALEKYSVSFTFDHLDDGYEDEAYPVSAYA